jgi:hypothetical protein
MQTKRIKDEMSLDVFVKNEQYRWQTSFENSEKKLKNELNKF